MRYALAAIFVCAVGMPAASCLPASGLPMVSPDSVSVWKAMPLAQAAKRNQPRSYRNSRNGDGVRRHHNRNRNGNGIHPLVGSGDY